MIADLDSDSDEFTVHRIIVFQLIKVYFIHIKMFEIFELILQFLFKFVHRNR